MGYRTGVSMLRLMTASRRAACAVLAAVALSLAFDVSPLHAQGVGDLLITPQRIVLSGRTRSAEVVLMNRGSAKALYRISFQQLRMTPQGGFEEIEEEGPGERFADKLIRYSPRQVELEPGQRLIAIYGISIPIIVRHGELAYSVAIADLVLEPAMDEDEVGRILITFTREGGRSVYGDITALYTPDGGGEEIQIGLVRGVAVYVPNTSRSILLALRMPDGQSLTAGTIDVTYREPAKEGGKVMATAQITVP